MSASRPRSPLRFVGDDKEGSRPRSALRFVGDDKEGRVPDLRFASSGMIRRGGVGRRRGATAIERLVIPEAPQALSGTVADAEEEEVGHSGTGSSVRWRRCDRLSPISANASSTSGRVARRLKKVRLSKEVAAIPKDSTKSPSR
jgi:hypothetical protein